MGDCADRSTCCSRMPGGGTLSITNPTERQRTTRKLPTRGELKKLHWLWAIIPAFIIVYLLTRPPQLVISDTSVFNITENSATVTCNTNIDCFCIMNLKLPNQVWVNFDEEDQSKSTRHVFNLNDLQTGSNYHLKIYADDSKPVISQEGYYSAESDEISFYTKRLYAVISDLRISNKYASWSTNIPTSFIIYDNGEVVARSEGYEYATSHSVSLNLSPYFYHLLTVKVIDKAGFSTESASIPIEGQFAHRIIPYYSNVSPCGLVELIDNPEAKDPTYGQLVAFLEMDITDKRLYREGFFTCGDYAEILHNNAEKAGWRAAFIVLKIRPPREMSIYTPYLFQYQQPKQDTTPDTILHACNAFQTKDLGLVFIDNTGVSERGAPVFTPGRADKVVQVGIGGQYCAENIFKRTGTYYECMGTVLEYIVYWSGTEADHYPGTE